MPALRYIFKELAGDRVRAEFTRTSSGLIGYFQQPEEKCLDERECFDHYKMALANKNNANGSQPSQESADGFLSAFREIRAYKKSKGIPYDVVNEDTFPFDRN